MPLQQPHATYRGYRTAGIRLSEELDASAVVPGISDPASFLAAAHRFDKAHVVMLTERELIPRSAGAAILNELRRLEKHDIVEQRARVGGERHSGEQYLIRALGEDVGGHINLARSSGDLGAVSRRIVHRDHLLDLVGELNALRGALHEQATAHVETVMPGYTHGQVAQATTFGHWLAMWANVFARDCERALALYRRLNLSPAGAGMLTGSDIPVDRERTAHLLGFDGPIPHTMDAILSHDTDCLETAAVLGIATANLGRLGDDLQLWFSSEFGFVDVPDRFCGTSSIMPQKRNPDFPEATKSIAVLAVSGLTSAFLAEKGPTGLSFRERRVTDDTLDRVFTLAIAQLAATTTVLRDVTVDANRTLAAATGGWAQATDLAAAVSRHSALPWRSAHQIVGILVRLCGERGLLPQDVTPQLVDEAAVAYLGRPVELPEMILRDALDPRQGVERRTLLGGPSPHALRAALASLQHSLDRDRAEVTAVRNRLEGAAADLEQAIDDILTRPSPDGP
ncbi:argininosuccinate lyase [Jiangella gansuensis]|uniref:argininosuccinate lyase n=1 Tax=Jiangella gansuensis TaxID=281473 RepID=UPI00047BE8F0|nr:argininosuccinate lyase [Jiangella gansuensis]